MTANAGQNMRPGAETHNVAEQWEEQEFADAWVTKDDGRQDVRVPMVGAAMEAIPHERDAAISVLDVGAGYGMVTMELFKAHPNANVTLQDISKAMFVHAKKRLAEKAGQTRFVIADFSKPTWVADLKGPYDVAISAIAIHNMYDDNLISSIYKDICGLLKPGATFINLDLAGQSGGVDAHIQWLKEGGFASVDCTAATERISLLVAKKA